MSWLADLVPSPDARKPLSLDNFVNDILPVFLLYYATAILVLLKDTFNIRLTLLPITLWLAFRAATGLEVASHFDSERLVYLNHGFVLIMTGLGMRVTSWTFQHKPFIRYTSAIPNGCGKPETGYCSSPSRLASDAFELCCNLRGHGWSWSNGLYLPPETRPLSRIGFLRSTTWSLVLGLLAFDILHFSAQSFEPISFMSASGGSIYDASLPLIPRYLRSSFICFICGLVIYNAIQLSYHFATLVGILIFQQQPSQWPPLFEDPWLATSLTGFWARYWHQLFRDSFIYLGFKPMSYIAGRPAGTLGAFFVSSILHVLGLWGMGKGTEFSSISTFFMMNGVGIIVEHAWKRLTGRKVGGFFGWIWLVVWTVGWSNFLFDVYSRKGLISSIFFPDALRPSRLLLRLVSHVLQS
ncbi:hypothetical protein AMATHDRAFT_55783 [Amanita thiersii Skay4041]|uniref:Wax synthase domain-containing protein n=1 Tax=Amanita thiersii Skay4041 TaxID=703135 RepID=A0A2A9NPK2_9AGAR|nr:hypothetical protein AMATHDRAFT_55783 [Amanita thiersii Skay4041]